MCYDFYPNLYVDNQNCFIIKKAHSKFEKSKRVHDVRSKELFSTAVPLPYEIYATLKTEKFNEAERMIHRSIDRISDLRINKSRGFFNIAPEKAYEILSDIKDLLGDEAELNSLVIMLNLNQTLQKEHEQKAKVLISIRGDSEMEIKSHS